MINKIRILLLIPEGLTFDMLTQEQQTAINSVFGEYTLPMVGTIAANGKVICDALALNTFNPVAMVEVGLPFEIIGMWDFQGTALTTFNEAEFMARLPETPIMDESGFQIGSAPAVLHEPCSWGGWPRVIGV